MLFVSKAKYKALEEQYGAEKRLVENLQDALKLRDEKEAARKAAVLEKIKDLVPEEVIDKMKAKELKEKLKDLVAFLGKED